MMPLFHAGRECFGKLPSAIERRLALDLEVLRQSDYFSIRFFVSLELALFYFVGSVCLAIIALPDRPLLYAFACGSTGICAGWLGRWAWRVGRKPSAGNCRRIE